MAVVDPLAEEELPADPRGRVRFLRGPLGVVPSSMRPMARPRSRRRSPRSTSRSWGRAGGWCRNSCAPWATASPTPRADLPRVAGVNYQPPLRPGHAAYWVAQREVSSRGSGKGRKRRAKYFNVAKLGHAEAHARAVAARRAMLDALVGADVILPGSADRTFPSLRAEAPRPGGMPPGRGAGPDSSPWAPVSTGGRTGGTAWRDRRDPRPEAAGPLGHRHRPAHRARPQDRAQGPRARPRAPGPRAARATRSADRPVQGVPARARDGLPRALGPASAARAPRDGPRGRMRPADRSPVHRPAPAAQDLRAALRDAGRAAGGPRSRRCRPWPTAPRSASSGGSATEA